MGKLTRILRQTVGDDRTQAEKREDAYQRAEGMTEPGSSIERRRQERKPDARLVRGLGERIGFAGIVAFTAGAALLGAAGCRDGAPMQQPIATCDEPATWCGGQR